MSIEKLKQLLEQGLITQDEFDALAQGIEPAAEPEQPEEPENEGGNDDDAEQRYQSRLDRAMAKERKEKADLKKQLQKLQRKMMTEDEAKQAELDQQQKEIEEQRKELTLEKNKMYAVKAMKKANMSDTDETMSLIEKLVVSCEDETDIDDAIALLKAWHDKAVTAEVNKRFKENGYTTKKGENLNGGVNPYSKEQFNLTQQMQIESTNPELAAQLKAAVGIK